MMEHHESVSPRWERAKVVSLWVMVILLAVNLWALFGSAINPTTGNIIVPGTEVLPCTFNVFAEGANVFARNCSTGAITYSGASGTSVIQSALTAIIPVHGSIDFAPGTYNVHGLTVVNGTSATHGIALRGASGSFRGTVFSYDGGAGGTILTISGCQWCSIDHIDFNGNNAAATALSIQGLAGAGSFMTSIEHSVFHFTTTYGLLLGATNNYQVSELTLVDDNALNTGTGLQILGTNTLNIAAFGTELNLNSIGLNVTAGGFYGYDTTFTTNTVTDISIWKTTAPFALYGGYSEASAKFLTVPCDAGVFTGSVGSITISDVKYLPGTPGAIVVDDCSQADVLFSHDVFQNGAQLKFRGNYGPTTPPAQKRFVDSVFYSSIGAPISGAANIIHGLYKDAEIVFDQYPLGLAATPFASWGSDSGIDPWTVNTHAAAPTGSFRNYTVDGQDAYITSTGGTGVTGYIYDFQGNVFYSGWTTLTNFYVPIGYQVTWGAFSGAPTVTVHFAGV